MMPENFTILFFYIQSCSHSLSPFLLSAYYYVASTLPGTGNLKVSKTDMVLSHINFRVEWGRQLLISGGLRETGADCDKC